MVGATDIDTTRTLSKISVFGVHQGQTDVVSHKYTVTKKIEMIAAQESAEPLRKERKQQNTCCMRGKRRAVQDHLVFQGNATHLHTCIIMALTQQKIAHPHHFSSCVGHGKPLQELALGDAYGLAMREVYEGTAGASSAVRLGQ